MAVRDLVARIILRLQDEASQGLNSARDSVRGVGQEIDRVKQLAIGLFSFVAIKTAIEQMVGLSDKFANLSARIKLTTTTQQEYNTAQSELFNIAQRSRTSLESVIGLYAKVQVGIRSLGGSQQQAFDTTEAVTQAFKISGASASESAGGIQQLTQSMSSGVLRGEEFNSVMENGSRVAQALADGLGVPISKLRSMAEAGELTSTRVINALLSQKAVLAAEYAQLPITVSGAWQKLENQFLKYIGTSKNASDATRSIADSIEFVTNHLDELISLAVRGGEVVLAMFAANKLNVLMLYTQGLLASAAAARADAEAAALARIQIVALLESKAAAARAGVTAQAALVEEARLEVALARTVNERTLATRRLTAELNALNIAQGKAQTANAALAASREAAVVGTGLLARAVGLLKTSINGLLLIPLVPMIAEWGLKLDWFYALSMRVQEALVIMLTGVKSVWDGMSASDRWAQIKQIHEEFNQLIAKNSASAKQAATDVAASEQAKTQAIETEAIKQKEAFKTVQDAVKALTASIDADTKMQTASIEQGLTERLAAIDAMNIAEAQKDTLRVSAKLEAYSLELQLQQQAGAAKLALIDREYQAELAGAANNVLRTHEIENQKRQDKLAVYTGLAEYYQGEVNRLSSVYASEMMAAQQAKQQLANLNQSHEQELFNIKLMGMTEREKLDAEESRFNELTRKIEAEQRKGDQADQEKIKGWLNEAKGLHDKITASVKDSAEAQSDARSRVNKLYGLEKIDLENSAENYEGSAKRQKKALDGVKEKLAETQTSIASITEQLNKEYALKIGIDSASLTAAQTTIAALTAPATKTITIETVNAGGDTPTATATAAPAAQSTGGPAGQPTGVTVGEFIRRLNTGGHVEMTGKLPGYGGGDKIKALLEPGEFIIRKEAVQKLGTPFMHLVNAGKVPVGDVIRRAIGGPVDPKDWQLVENGLFGIAQSTGQLSLQGVGNSQAIASGQAWRNDDIVWKALTTQVDDLAKRARTPDIKDEAINILRMAASEFQRNGAQADMDGIKARIKQMIDKRAVKSPQASGTRSPALGMKALGQALSATPFANIQEEIQQRASTFSLPVPTLPSQAVATASQSTPSGNAMRVQFVAPDGAKSEGMFNSSDATAMLRVLKDAGARTV